MIRVTSHKITEAIKQSPRINEVYNDELQRLLSGEHPYASENKFYDSGKPRGTFLDTMGPGMGTNDRAPIGGSGIMGLGREHKKDPRDPTSGYNDGGRADDETGPGFRSPLPVGNDGDNQGTEPINEAFLKFDNLADSKSRDSVQDHLNMTFNGPSVPPRKRKAAKIMKRRLKYVY